MILLCTLSYPSNGARMLGVLGSDSKSRYANIRNLADELVSRGHEVCSVICYSGGQGAKLYLKPRRMMTLFRLLRASTYDRALYLVLGVRLVSGSHFKFDGVSRRTLLKT